MFSYALRAYKEGYQKGYDAGTEIVEILRQELAELRESTATLQRRFDEQLERANVAADELLLNQGGRRAISMASARFDDEQEQKQLATIKTAEAEASEMFRTRTYDDPEATFASEDEARGEYA